MARGDSLRHGCDSSLADGVNAMTADFKDMAAKAKAAHETRMAEKAQKDRAENEERSRVVDAAVADLTTNVIPIFERAAAIFREHQIETDIAKDFDVKGFVSKKPSVSFMCFGPKRTTDGYQFKTRAAIVESDSAKIIVTVTRDVVHNAVEEKLGSSISAEGESLVTQAVNKVLEAYYMILEKHKSHRTL